MRIWIISVLVLVLGLPVQAQYLWTQHVVVDDFDMPWYSTPADLDQDGDMDILCCGNLEDEIAWWENDGTQQFIRQSISGFFDGARSLEVFDCDSDGDLDVVGAALEADEIRLFVNDGNENFTSILLISNYNEAQTVHATDLDLDGDVDIVGVSRQVGQAYWWEYDDGEYFQHPLITQYYDCNNIESADLDQDGDMDLLASIKGPYYGRRLTWWENDSAQNFTVHLLNPELTNASRICPVDLDQDGDQDIVGSANLDETLAWWENNGFAEFSYHMITNTYDHANSIFPFDMDLDGDWDLLATAIDDDDLSWWQNDGFQHFTKNTISDSYEGSTYALAADMDTDGDLDIVSCAYPTDNITWWEQTETFLTIELEPFGMPIVIPGQGGHFDFQVRIVNTSNEPHWFAAWTEAILPNGNLYSPVQLNNFVGIGPYSGLVAVVRQGVPGFAPTGQYQYIARIGDYPALTMSLGSFTFSKGTGGTTAPAVLAWSDDGLDDLTACSTESMPDEYVVVSVYPNPFNAMMTVAVKLPIAAELTVTVFNVAGQQVAVLTEGNHAVGTHMLVFDGSSLASGIYFVHAMLPGRLDQMQKVVLVR
ncbi:T9SS type A sorting domain-containing protein [bacterium]|nr:T9SS type A sorting domain-containing protein [bacterium]